MNYNVSRKLVSECVSRCANVDYPVAVTGQDFGDSLSYALMSINELSEKVEQLESILGTLLKQLEENK